MWFLVNLPGNKLNIAVKSDRNSIAAECLNKVSKINQGNYYHKSRQKDSNNTKVTEVQKMLVSICGISIFCLVVITKLISYKKKTQN